MEEEEVSSEAALRTAKPGGEKATKGSGQSAPGKRHRTVSSGDARKASDSSIDEDEGEDELQFVGPPGSDTEEDSEGVVQEVEASFELFDPHDEDAPGVLLLLRNARVYPLLGLESQHLTALAEVIAGQVSCINDESTVEALEEVYPTIPKLNTGKIRLESQAFLVLISIALTGNIGSIARATSEAEGRSEAAVGLVSLLSIGQYPKATQPLARKILSLAQEHASEKCLSELRKLLAIGQSSSSSSSCKGTVKGGSKTAAGNTCLFISSRFTNLPLEVAAEAAEALIEDVRWSLETPEMDEEERPWYRFTHVIGVTLIYRDPHLESGTRKKQKHKHALGLEFSPSFAEFEQQVLSDDAPVAFAAPTKQTVRFSSVPSGEGPKGRARHKRTSVMQTLQEYLLIYALPYEQFVLNSRKIKQRLALQASFKD